MFSPIFTLLQKRRFLPLFITQFLGAFNDNFLKNAMAILIIYQLGSTAVNPSTLVTIAGGIFILPFFLFSANAGQLADKLEKVLLIKLIKLTEIIAMLIAAIGFFTTSKGILFTSLFLMGVNSAFFGPIKYAILPQHIKPQELLGANALVEGSTFIAILLGTIAGGLLISLASGVAIVSLAGVILAILGLISGWLIPQAPGPKPELKPSFNIISVTWRTVREAKKHTQVFNVIWGISWFWLVGAIFLSLVPGFIKEQLTAGAQVATLFLATFSVGIGCGALFCSKLLKGQASTRYVPVTLLVMAIFSADLFFASHTATQANPENLLTVAEFLGQFQGWRTLFDAFMLATAGGMFTLPLYTLLQTKSELGYLSRVIATTNIINAFFMVVSALAVALLLELKVSIPQIFLLLAICNAILTLYAAKRLPNSIIGTWLMRKNKPSIR
jgi:acyl-[acyl-carrier-protein]-phospholipid O-acyltransferase/long-chain-fatty-acid--[acyl-carrier-protein] ligase